MSNFSWKFTTLKEWKPELLSEDDNPDNPVCLILNESNEEKAMFVPHVDKNCKDSYIFIHDNEKNVFNTLKEAAEYIGLNDENIDENNFLKETYLFVLSEQARFERENKYYDGIHNKYNNVLRKTKYVLSLQDSDQNTQYDYRSSLKEEVLPPNKEDLIRNIEIKIIENFNKENYDFNIKCFNNKIVNEKEDNPYSNFCKKYPTLQYNIQLSSGVINRNGKTEYLDRARVSKFIKAYLNREFRSIGKENLEKIRRNFYKFSFKYTTNDYDFGLFTIYLQNEILNINNLLPFVKLKENIEFSDITSICDRISKDIDNYETPIIDQMKKNPNNSNELFNDNFDIIQRNQQVEIYQFNRASEKMNTKIIEFNLNGGKSFTKITMEHIMNVLLKNFSEETNSQSISRPSLILDPDYLTIGKPLKFINKPEFSIKLFNNKNDNEKYDAYIVKSEDEDTAIYFAKGLTIKEVNNLLASKDRAELKIAKLSINSNEINTPEDLKNILSTRVDGAYYGQILIQYPNIAPHQLTLNLKKVPKEDTIFHYVLKISNTRNAKTYDCEIGEDNTSDQATQFKSKYKEIYETLREKNLINENGSLIQSTDTATEKGLNYIFDIINSIKDIKYVAGNDYFATSIVNSLGKINEAIQNTTFEKRDDNTNVDNKFHKALDKSNIHLIYSKDSDITEDYFKNLINENENQLFIIVRPYKKEIDGILQPEVFYNVAPKLFNLHTLLITKDKDSYLVQNFKAMYKSGSIADFDTIEKRFTKKTGFFGVEEFSNAKELADNLNRNKNEITKVKFYNN